jgi:hypothetical protein
MVSQFNVDNSFYFAYSYVISYSAGLSIAGMCVMVIASGIMRRARWAVGVARRGRTVVSTARAGAVVNAAVTVVH